ncbi:response regulator transcription factor [Amnibacterium kyonggiense]|uniref:LuxR family two component transcriptional regulator n=1 Tax=Amnibacterium kyonggiense TaxID=595671 RepID=A0A4R7FH04_9MICO|nr:response regulator transcription factor [Amnibacterium kyonggiense]TDS74920.1 LuxR family two component transcriptional regulator [Amnibacterium kyonggiense]
MDATASTPSASRAPRPISLVDDHQLVGLALVTALGASTDLKLVGAFPTVDALLRKQVRPGLVLLDLRLADGSSPAANVRRIREAGGDVLVFTSGEDAYLVREALHADVLGLLRKSTPVEVMIHAIGRAALGQPVVTSEWAHAVESDPQLSSAALSPQESRVLQLFADGARSQRVAEELHITVGTLEDYIRRIRTKYAKVGRPAPTKVDLYKRAVEDGLLPAPGRE